MAAQEFMPREDVVARIRKDIEQYEVERLAAYRQVQWRVPVFFGLLLILVGALAYAFNSFASPYEQWTSSPHVILYFFAIASTYFVYVGAMRPATRLKQSFRDRVLPVIFGFVDDLRYTNGKTPESFDRLPRAAVGGFNQKTFDDVVSGTYDGFAFELYETTLTAGSGKSKTTVFKGVVMAFEAEAPFPGMLVAAKKTGTVSKFFRDVFSARQLEEVTSGIAALDDAYEFRTDSAGVARPLVSGKLAKVLQWLNDTWPGEPPRVALQGRDGFLLLPLSRNFFELPSISSPLDYKAHVEPMVADLVSLLATASLVRKVGAPDENPAEDPQS